MKPDTTSDSSSNILKTSLNHYKEIPKSSYRQKPSRGLWPYRDTCIFQVVPAKMYKAICKGIEIATCQFCQPPHSYTFSPPPNVLPLLHNDSPHCVFGLRKPGGMSEIHTVFVSLRFCTNEVLSQVTKLIIVTLKALWIGDKKTLFGLEIL